MTQENANQADTPFSPREPRPKILIVDDVPANLRMLSALLEPEGYQIFSAPNGNIALKIATQAHPDLILLDVVMPGRDGFETCQCLKNDPSTVDIPIVFVTAKGETDNVVKGFTVGGVDYIPKPFEETEVLARVKTHLTNAQLTRALQQKNTELEAEIARREQTENALQRAGEQLSVISTQEAERWGIPGLVSQSATMQGILDQIRRLHHNDTTSVLITGESGTGKEMIARAIHHGGPRRKGPLLTLNCSAIPVDLAESTLFGHIRGAFTGANTDKSGYFELANNGTLFLDEIGEMPIQLQPKLLRALEEGLFTPIGATQEKQTDVRIIAATNVDFQTKIAAGEFREDLYFRLAGFPVHVPPLRERKEDIPLLVSHFLSHFTVEMRYAEKPAMSKDALTTLQSYAFPGNIRELKNIIERAMIESSGGEILPEHLHLTPIQRNSPSNQDSTAGLPLNLQEAEVLLIQRALKQTDGNLTEAGRLLGVTRQTLWRKLPKEN